MINKESNCHSNECNICYLIQKGQDTKTNWPTDRLSGGGEEVEEKKDEERRMKKRGRSRMRKNRKRGAGAE
jgi:hypothetical protein